MEFFEYQTRAGHPNWQQCHEAAMELAVKIEPLILKQNELTTSDRLQDAARKGKALKKALENLLINRGRYKQGNHALRPLYVIWTMLNACNFRCTYCDNHQGEKYFDIPDPDRLDTEASKRLLDKMITGTSAIYWCGGEPTMRDDLPELLDHAWRLGYFPNMINTNGSLLHQRLQKPAWRKFLWQMDVIIISLDGLDLPKLRKLWGVKKPEQVIVNLLLLRELRKSIPFKLAVNTVITKDNLDEVRDILNLTADLDIWFVPVPVNYKHRPNSDLLDDPGYQELARLIVRRKQRGQKIIGSPRLLQKLLYAEPYQCLTALKPHVWSNGHIAWPCRAAQTNTADVDLMAYDSFDDAYEAGRKLVNPDFFHGTNPGQCGGDCAWMQNYTTARYLDGITDPIGSGFVNELYEFIFSGFAK